MVELSAEEMQQIDGGVVPVIIAGFWVLNGVRIGIAIGYALS